MNNILDDHLFDPSRKEEYQSFREFLNLEEAQAFAAVLKANDIYYLMEGTRTLLDKSIVGQGMIPKAVIKLLPEDFRQVNELIKKELSNLTFESIADHHLNSLSTEELNEIFKAPQDWSVEDASIAQLILKHRGHPISDEEIQQLRAERNEEIRAGKAGHKAWVFGYALSIVLGIFYGMLLYIAGIGMAYYYAFDKSVNLPSIRKLG